MTILPSSLKFTVTFPPILLCTWPVPQSGCWGWRTNIPGVSIAFKSSISCPFLLRGFS